MKAIRTLAALTLVVALLFACKKSDEKNGTADELAVSGDPAAFWATLKEAQNHYRAGKWELAAPGYERALSYRTDNETALFELAHCYFVMGRPDRAEDLWTELAKSDPLNGRVAASFAALYGETLPGSPRDLERAAVWAAKSIGLNREDSEPWVVAGRIALERGRLEEAAHDLAAACRMNPKARRAAMLLAAVHRREGRAEEARAVLEQVIRVATKASGKAGVASEGDTAATLTETEMFDRPNLLPLALLAEIVRVHDLPPGDGDQGLLAAARKLAPPAAASLAASTASQDGAWLLGGRNGRPAVARLVVASGDARRDLDIDGLSGDATAAAFVEDPDGPSGRIAIGELRRGADPLLSILAVRFAAEAAPKIAFVTSLGLRRVVIDLTISRSGVVAAALNAGGVRLYRFASNRGEAAPTLVEDPNPGADLSAESDAVLFFDLDGDGHDELLVAERRTLEDVLVARLAADPPKRSSLRAFDLDARGKLVDRTNELLGCGILAAVERLEPFRDAAGTALCVRSKRPLAAHCEPDLIVRAKPREAGPEVELVVGEALPFPDRIKLR